MKDFVPVRSVLCHSGVLLEVKCTTEQPDSVTAAFFEMHTRISSVYMIVKISI